MYIVDKCKSTKLFNDKINHLNIKTFNVGHGFDSWLHNVQYILQVFMNMSSWRMAVVKDYRSMLKTVFTVKPVISRTPVRTSTGCVPREGRDQHTMECEQSDRLTSHIYYCCGFTKLTLV